MYDHSILPLYHTRKQKTATYPPYLSPEYINNPTKFEKQIMDEINRRVDETIQNLIIDKFFIQMNQE